MKKRKAQSPKATQQPAAKVQNTISQQDTVAKRQISLPELFFVLLALLLPFEYGLTLLEKQLGSWSLLLLVLLAVAGLLLGGLYYLWYTTFYGMDFAQIMQSVYGRIGGKIVLFVIIMAFWAVIVDFSYTLAYLWGISINVNPLRLLIAILLLVSLMAMAGQTAISRLAALAISVAVILMLIGLLVVMSRGTMDNMFSLNSAGAWDWAQLGVTGFAIIFGLMFFTLPFFNDIVISTTKPDTREAASKGKKLCLSFSAAVITADILLVLIVFCGLTVLGNTLTDYELPLLQCLKMFSVGSSFNQTEMIGILIYETIGVVGLAFMFCAINKVTSAIISVKNIKFLSVAWAILTFIAVMVLFPHVGSMLEMLRGCTTTAVWLAAVIIPICTLIINKLKKH